MNRSSRNLFLIIAASLLVAAMVLSLNDGGVSAGLLVETPTIVGSWDVSGNAHDGVYVVGNRAYLTDWVRGFDIVDISDPAHPQHLANLPLSGNGMDVVVDGNYAYVTMKSGGLRIVDVSDPQNPVQKSWIKADPEKMDLTLHLFKNGDLVYVADEYLKVVIYNVSSPTSPFKVGECDVSYAESVWIDGSYAYVTGGNLGLRVFDVSNPASPGTRGSLATTGFSYDVQVVWPYAYVAEGNGGLRVVNVSDPWNPQHVTSVSTASEAYDIRIANGYAYIAERNAPGHMEVFDLSDPEAPVLVSRYQSTNQINGVYPTGGYVYCAAQDRGLLVLDAQLGPTPTPTATATPTVTATPTDTPQPTATIDPSMTTSLSLQVQLQGRGDPPSSNWENELHVELEATGGPGPYAWDATCDASGLLALTGVPQGIWSVSVRDGSSLVNVRHGAILSGDSVLLDMGTLIAGDTNLDERINILDFSVLATVYGTSQGDGEYRAESDLNDDGRVNLLDFSILASNYGATGPIELD